MTQVVGVGCKGKGLAQPVAQVVGVNCPRAVPVRPDLQMVDVRRKNQEFDPLNMRLVGVRELKPGLIRQAWH